MVATIGLLICEVLSAGLFPMKIIFWICFVINVIWVFGFLVLTVNQITSHLKIKCFSLEKSKSLKSSKMEKKSSE
jgi:hypothetical protein